MQKPMHAVPLTTMPVRPTAATPPESEIEVRSDGDPSASQAKEREARERRQLHSQVDDAIASILAIDV